MARILVLIALICLVNAAVRSGKTSSTRRPPTDRVHWISKLCENEAIGRSVLSKIQDVIKTLEADDSYGKVLEKFAQSIAYIKNDSNEDILSSNCTGYYNGLNNARKADRKTEELQEYYEEYANRLLRQILFPIIGSFGFNFLT